MRIKDNLRAAPLYTAYLVVAALDWFLRARHNRATKAPTTHRKTR